MGRYQHQQISTTLIDESFASEDDEFLDRLRQSYAAPYLAGLADRWKKDPRPWARLQILRYVALPFDQPGHHPVVKRLFKQAEADRDHELMAAFLVAFDRLVRRQRRTRFHYDYRTRQSWREEELYAPGNQITATAGGKRARDARTGKPIFRQPSPYAPRGGRLFSYRTRRYLQRRAWRYFRRLAFQRPQEYCAAAAAALALYRDEDLAKGENILDSRSLVQIAFGHSPVLKISRLHVAVVDGKSLGELTPAPRFGVLWQRPEAGPVLLTLLMTAQARLVRVWATQLLKRDHQATLSGIEPAQLLALLDHADEEVQQFAAGLLETAQGVDAWPIEMWLKLLETRSVTALAIVCQAMEKRVRPERLTFVQCVTLACARATPVARLGLAWLRGRSATSASDRAALLGLTAAQCDAVGVDVAEFALSILGAPSAYRTDEVIRFFDSLNANVRSGAWNWLTPTSPGYQDPALWSHLLETPYDDVRLKLVNMLHERTIAGGQRAAPASLKRQDFSEVWTMVLLNVHRGGRAKLTALRQISQAIAADPPRAERLVPVLAVAIRSVRPPEARAGLAAILSAVAVHPPLEGVLARHLPELRLTPQEATP